MMATFAIRRLSRLQSYRAPQIRAFSSSSYVCEELRKTALYDYHVENGANMVPFAGYLMPLSYGNVGAVASHHHVRNSVGLFDVGHMVQSNILGLTATEFLEWLTPSSLSSLPEYHSTLTVLLNEHGGIIDDAVLTKHAANAFRLVTNAARRDRDLAWIDKCIEQWNAGSLAKTRGPVSLELLDGWGLLALQGPDAAPLLQGLTAFDLRTLTFGRAAYVPLEGFNLHVSRGGYTGEDGFEISVRPEQTVEFTRQLVRSPVQLTGLGARDSLRLEAGMCLYGHDLHEDTTPVEAGLTWVIGKDRRQTGNFIGAEVVREHLKNGPPRRRIGLIVEGAPAREGATILTPDGAEKLGAVTSGIPSPTLGLKNIAMGYVRSGQHNRGTKLAVDVRGRLRPAIVTSMPFVPTRYWRGA